MDPEIHCSALSASVRIRGVSLGKKGAPPMSLWEGVQREFHEAAGEYFEALMRAGVPEELGRRAAEAYERYAEVLQDAWSATELQERALGAYLEYTDVVAQAWAPDALAERASEAYRTYIHALRDAWVTVDVDTIDATALGAIANGMLSVAWTAGLSSAGVVRERAEGG
jgi:hypothetical protein